MSIINFDLVHPYVPSFSTTAVGAGVLSTALISGLGISVSLGFAGTAVLIKKVFSKFFVNPPKRPAEIEIASTAAFKKVADLSKPGAFTFKGWHNYCFSFDKHRINARHVIDTLHQQRPGAPFSILDIGTGNGKFIKAVPSDIEAYGISADDMRSKDHGKYDPHYIVGNAEKLDVFFPKQQFDFVVSHMTFRYLFDPLEGLKQAYKALKPDGILIVDSFVLQGIDVERWTEDLQRLGYEAISLSTFDDYGIQSKAEFFAIRKTKPVLETSIEYAEEQTGYTAVYRFREESVHIDSYETPVLSDN